MAQATLVHGKPLMVDYTPGVAVSAGDVVLVGNRPLIAQKDIAAGELGALAAGGGVYRGTAGEALAAGDKAYWDDVNDQVKKAPGVGETYYHLGFVVPSSSASAAGDLVDIQHDPDGSTVSG